MQNCYQTTHKTEYLLPSPRGIAIADAKHITTKDNGSFIVNEGGISVLDEFEGCCPIADRDCHGKCNGPSLLDENGYCCLGAF